MGSWLLEFGVLRRIIAEFIFSGNYFRKIAIKDLAILQTCDLAAIHRYHPFLLLHRILPLSPSMRGIKGEGSVAKMSAALSGSQLAGFPKN